MIRHAPSFGRLAFSLAALLFPALPSYSMLAAEKPLDFTDQTLAQMHWRSLGPAVMGGRIADIAVDPKRPYTIYAALATGGLIKTVNDGATWTPLFDGQQVASVGAVAVAPSDPRTIWVGTGEANGRNSSAWGDGVYRSTDGGATWKNMGLKETREIGRIVIDPKDPNIVYVAATGRLWGLNRERGLFKTTDGGKTWQHSLAIDAETGVIDVALGVPDTNIVYAAAYSRLRYPWGFQGISNKSGLYRSTDAGKTWKRCVNGLPTEAIGRIGLCVSQSKPNIVYAVIESTAGGAKSLFDNNSLHGGVFRSDDSGETWKRASGTAPRGFYFSQIRVDPTNPDRVYVLGFGLSVSDDGGKTFKAPAYAAGLHPDLHAMWIDPAYPEHLLLGTDGGLYVSHDQSKTWRALHNFPMGEFYEVSVDNQQPYWVYGGLQDNGCWAGPSATLRGRGPINTDWLSFPSGDGFYVLSDPQDPMIVYEESQNGAVTRIDRHTNQMKGLSPIAPEGQPDYRFNWNTPLCLSRYDHDALYIGGNHLFKFVKKGAEWSALGPDLSKQEGPHITTSGSGAEAYGTIVVIAESPFKRGTIWIGTDDGNVQLTLDEGATWTDLTNNLPSRVRKDWVTRIEPSQYAPGRAYLSIDGHRSDDLAPYLFVTEDYGKSWRSLVGDLPKEGTVQAFREDPMNPNLLFAGTDFGAFISFDRGERWRKLGEGLPTVAVDDLAIQPRDHALVAATHGRSLWVLDNIAPLETAAAQPKPTDVVLFPVAPALEYLPDFQGDSDQAEFAAQNPPSGAHISYWLASLADEAPHFEIADAKGNKVATLNGERYPGIGQVSWDLREASEGGRRFGPSGAEPKFVKPGLYTVTMTLGKAKQTQQVMVNGPAALSEIATESAHREEEFGDSRPGDGEH